jgi:hypothetical protein
MNAAPESAHFSIFASEGGENGKMEGGVAIFSQA